MSRYRMKLERPKEKFDQYVGLRFGDFVEQSDQILCNDPIIQEAVGDYIDYGALFAYLFRRFGYPNFGWADYKELARYWLTTRRADMTLEVVPYTGGASDRTFTFLVPLKVRRAIEKYDMQEHTAWTERLLGWYQDNYTPPDWINHSIEFLSEAYGWSRDELTWRDVYHFAVFAGDKKAINWRKEIIVRYETIEPAPPMTVPREREWRNWPDDDPLKPYAAAAYEALEQLYKPVAIRDVRINAFGVLDDGAGGRGVKPAAAAGYPSGDLGNEDPESFAELHELIEALGQGSGKRGISKALRMLKAVEA